MTRYRLAEAALNFVMLTATFWPLEKLWPARPGQPWLRPAWLTDLAYFLGQYLVLGALVLKALVWLEQESGLAHNPLRTAVAGLPLGGQVLLAVGLSDVAVYWAHRLSHQIPWLWRFHAVHHSAEHLDWLAAHREHPLDGLYTQVVVNLPIFLLGVPVEVLGGLVAFRGMWAIFIHSNVRIPLGPLRVLFGAPELHHWHHARVERTVHNFANLAPWVDVLFGTYHCPPEPETYPVGLPGAYPRGYWRQVLLAPVPEGDGDGQAPEAPAQVGPG